MIDSVAYSDNTTYSYIYDAVGNITEIKKNGTTIRSYVYDELNQLIRENNHELLQYVCYTYDYSGNIQSKTSHAWAGTVLDTNTYTYGNTQWGDLLTNYNGTDISYDASGNPLNWRNAAILNWQGRRLNGIALDAGYIHGLDFKYNADGIRIKKSYYDHTNKNMYSVTYALDGTKILSQTYKHSFTGETYTVKFFYDANDAPIAMEYDGNYYYYRTNIQGDIEGIYNANGALVVSYSYDAWGNILSTTGTLADTVGEINPFRYRGYYYDTETGLYYVSSRYYDPEICRFINADEIAYLGASGTISGYNLFAYCENKPVNNEDPTGNWLIQAICGIAGAVVFGTVANILCRLLDVNATVRRLITAGFALIGGVLGAAFGPSLVGKIAPKALEWVQKLEKIINKKSRLRPMLFEGHVAIGWEWDRRFKIMLHFKHTGEPEKGMHIAIQHFTGRNWRATIPDIPIKSLGKLFINWVKKYLY